MKSTVRLTSAILFACGVATSATAGYILVPCDPVPISLSAAAPMIRFAPHMRVVRIIRRPHRVLHTKHAIRPIRSHGGRFGAIHSLHAISGRRMCAVWTGGGLVGPGLADQYAREFGGGEFPDETAPTDLGGYSPAGFDAGGAGGGGSEGGGEPGFLAFTQPVGGSDVQNVPITPPCVDCGPVTPPAVPEASTWLMFAVGMMAIGVTAFRRRPNQGREMQHDE